MNKAFAYFLAVMTILTCAMSLGAQLNCSGGTCSPLFAQVGSVGAPSYSFVGFPTSGLYSRSGGRVITAVAGADIAGAASFGWGADAFYLDLANADIVMARASAGVMDIKDSTGACCGASAINVGTGTSTIGGPVTVGATSTVTITTAKVSMRGNAVLLDGKPTCSGAGCTMGSTSINSSGTVTTTTTGAADITVTFSASFQNAPVCLADNKTTGNLLRATTEAVGSFHLQGVTVNGDTLGWHCIGK